MYFNFYFMAETSKNYEITETGVKFNPENITKALDLAIYFGNKLRGVIEGSKFPNKKYSGENLGIVNDRIDDLASIRNVLNLLASQVTKSEEIEKNTLPAFRQLVDNFNSTVNDFLRNLNKADQIEFVSKLEDDKILNGADGRTLLDNLK